MNAMQFTLWISLLLTPFVLNGVGSSLMMPKRQIVAVGHTVVLTSRISQNVTLISVSWFKENVGQVLMYVDHNVILNEEYQNRAGLMHSSPRNDFSMYINNTNLVDSGHYTCSVAIFSSHSKKIVSGTTKLDVLIPPSTPKCSIIGSQYVGSNVTLTCHSANGKPTPQYSWERIGSKREFVSPRRRSNAKMGSLMFTNLSEAMSGLYTCKSENDIGNSSCSVQLNVMMPSNAGIIAGAIIGVLFGICLIIAIAVCFSRHQKKKKAEMVEYLANDIKEDAQAPSGNTWSKTESSDIISKNGTLSSMNSTMRAYRPYPKKSPSDTASTITATCVNNTGSYKHSNNVKKPASSSPTRSSPGQSAPTYINTHQSGPPSKWQNGVQKQDPRQAPTLSSMSPSNLTRMGAVPVMVPAQSQAGSLV